MLAGAAAGGLAGGLIGALTQAGVDESAAHVYAERIKRGGTVMIARVDESELDTAAAILGRHGHADVRSVGRNTCGGWAVLDGVAGDGAATPVVPAAYALIACLIDAWTWLPGARDTQMPSLQSQDVRTWAPAMSCWLPLSNTNEFSGMKPTRTSCPGERVADEPCSSTRTVPISVSAT
jgi:hypothetical protein